MRYTFGLFIGTLLSFASFSQNYQISFAGSGSSSTVESVYVENLTQCTSISLNGNDVLHLSTGSGIENNNLSITKDPNIFPNPCTGICNAEFFIDDADEITISISDISGKIIFSKNDYSVRGRLSYQISGLSKGIFFLCIESSSFCYKSKIVSLNSDSKSILVNKNESDFVVLKSENTNNYKSEEATIDMVYADGDLLKITGESGIYSTVVMLVPESDQAVTFNFIPCTDANGNNYSVVEIGDQWWMAENLNAGTYVPISTTQAAGTKFCMNINGLDDPTCPMGGLYEWNILMQEALPCNGTGAPPADRCNDPIQGLCPVGWHIPSHYEWTTLARSSGTDFGALDYNGTLGVGVDEGGNLKLNCTTNWWNPNAGATNATGFSGIPGGDTWDGVFEDFGQSSYYWTSSAIFTYTYNPWVYALNYSVAFVGRSQYFMENGFSCRCVKD